MLRHRSRFRPWGPSWAVPLVVVWPPFVGIRLGTGSGAEPAAFAAWLLGVSLWVALPFLGLGAVDAWRPVRSFWALATGGAVATALAWVPAYSLLGAPLVGWPLGAYPGPLAYPALASPLAGTFGMAVAGALRIGPSSEP